MWADLRGGARLCRKANAPPKSRNPDCFQQIGVSGSGAIGTRARQCTALGVIVEPSRPCCHASDVGARFKRLEAPTSPDPQQVGPEWQDEEPHTSHCVEAKAETHCGKSADFELSDVTALPGLWPPKSEATDRPASTSQGAEPAKVANVPLRAKLCPFARSLPLSQHLPSSQRSSRSSAANCHTLPFLVSWCFLSHKGRSPPLPVEYKPASWCVERPIVSTVFGGSLRVISPVDWRKFGPRFFRFHRHHRAHRRTGRALDTALDTTRLLLVTELVTRGAKNGA